MAQILINFANEKYAKAQKFNSWTGKHIAHFDKIYEFSPKDIDPIFAEKNKDIFDVKRGCGLWLWKPYFINRVIMEANIGDYIFYSDSGAFFINDISSLIGSMDDSEVWLYGLPLIEKQYSKEKVFQKMNCNLEQYRETNQFSGTFLMLKVGEYSRKFVSEWLGLCCDPDLILPMDSPEKDCISHREDQSILSVLAKKKNIVMHKDPSQYGQLPEKYDAPGRIFAPFDSDDTYKTVIVHHRTCNCDFVTCIKQFLCGILPRKIGLQLIGRNN